MSPSSLVKGEPLRMTRRSVRASSELLVGRLFSHPSTSALSAGQPPKTGKPQAKPFGSGGQVAEAIQKWKNGGTGGLLRLWS